MDFACDIIHSMKILVYSSLNIDSTFSVDHIVLPGETQLSTGFRKAAGGKGANQAVAIAKAGLKVYFAGKVGSDGEFALRKLNGYGVDTSFVHHTESCTGQAIIQLDREGQNSILLYSGGNQENTEEEIDSVLGNFGEGDILVMNGEINCLSYLMDRALRIGMRVFINASPVTDEILELPLNKAALLVVNEIEGAAIAGTRPDATYLEILNKMVKKFPKTEILLTLGKFGAYYGFRDTVEHSTSFDSEVVDTTCAGDTFLGYYLASRTNGKKVRKSLETACKASSITVSRPGAMDSIPFANEVEAIPDRI